MPLNQRLLQIITEAHVEFIDGCDKALLFPKLLQQCVELTESVYSFIGELVLVPPASPSTLHIISFNSQNVSLNTACPTLELSSPLTTCLSSLSPSISNSFDSNNNNNNNTFPPSFPPTKAFVGIPLFHHNTIIGMLGIGGSNRYNSALVDFLLPFSTTCATLMVGYRKALEQQNLLNMLENARREAEQSALAKAHFLSNMSHEIRTPLNGIIGLTSLILDSQMTFDQREMIETVQSSGDLLLSVVNDILDLAKFEAGKLQLHQIHFDVRACVEGCIDVIAIGAERKGIEVLCNIFEDVPGTMLGDFDRVRQILTNLIGNAVKFTDRGEVIVGVKIEDQKILQIQRTFSGELLDEEPTPSNNNNNTEKRNVVHFWVRDTGIGISRDKKDLLFKMYTQIDPFRTNGTGLGLSICKRLVEAMSGKIWASSEPGVGSCFHFAIPTVFGNEKIPYYPTIKLGKSLVIFSHLETHLQVLQDFARQHGMVPKGYLLGSGDVLSLSNLQLIANFSAAIIDLPQAEKIISQIERFFREGRASPQTPLATPSLNVRGIGQVATTTSTATSTPASFPPLMLPKATLRLTQISPVLAATSPSLEDTPSPLIPIPFSSPSIPPTPVLPEPKLSSPVSSKSTPSSLLKVASPTSPISIPSPNQGTNQAPSTKARSVSLPKHPNKPFADVSNAKTQSSFVSPILSPSQSPTSPKTSIESLSLLGTSPKRPLPPKPTSVGAKQPPSTSSPSQFSLKIPPSNTSTAFASIPSTAPSLTTDLGFLSSLSPRGINNLTSPRHNVPPLSGGSTSPIINSTLSASLQRSLKLNIGTSSSGPTPISTPGSTPSSSFIPQSPAFPSSTPPSPSASSPCPILLYMPLSSPHTRTTCTNLFFLPKPIKLSRLSKKLEAVIDRPYSPSTTARFGDRSTRISGSSSSLLSDDLIYDNSMSVVHPLTIVVGEDNLVGQVVTQRMLGKLGYTAEFCASGDGVLSKLENRVVDVVLLDLKMPVCDGFECARRICAALPPGHRPHIAAVTANILQSDRDLAAAVGFNDYITKPFLLQDLARVLARCKKLDTERTIPYSVNLLPHSPPVPISPSSPPASLSSTPSYPSSLSTIPSLSTTTSISSTASG